MAGSSSSQIDLQALFNFDGLFDVCLFTILFCSLGFSVFQGMQFCFVLFVSVLSKECNCLLNGWDDLCPVSKLVIFVSSERDKL